MRRELPECNADRAQVEVWFVANENADDVTGPVTLTRGWGLEVGAKRRVCL